MILSISFQNFSVFRRPPTPSSPFPLILPPNTHTHQQQIPGSVSVSLDTMTTAVQSAVRIMNSSQELRALTEPFSPVKYAEQSKLSPVSMFGWSADHALCAHVGYCNSPEQ